MYKQSHPETCLAKCLLILTKNSQETSEQEVSLLVSSLKYDRENIARGHLEKMVLDYPVNIIWYVGSKVFYNFTKKQGLNNKIKFEEKNIDLKTINKLSKPFIIYLDRFYLWKKNQNKYYRYHWPHFVIIEKKVKTGYKIIDPDDGKRKIIKSATLTKSIKELKRRLWLSPMVIIISKLSQ